MLSGIFYICAVWQYNPDNGLHYKDQYFILSSDLSIPAAKFVVLCSNEGCALAPFDGSIVEGSGVPYVIVPQEVQKRAAVWKSQVWQDQEKIVKEPGQKKQTEIYQGITLKKHLFTGVSGLAQLLRASRLCCFLF